MSYNKRTWANGNVVGAVDLNRMEQGIEDASGDIVLLVLQYDHYDTNDGAIFYNKTYQEVKNAIINGFPVFIQEVQVSFGETDEPIVTIRGIYPIGRVLEAPVLRAYYLRIDAPELNIIGLNADTETSLFYYALT